MRPKTRRRLPWVGLNLLASGYASIDQQGIWLRLVYHTTLYIYVPPSSALVAHPAPRPPRLGFDPYDERCGHVGSYYFSQRSCDYTPPQDREMLSSVSTKGQASNGELTFFPGMHGEMNLANQRKFVSKVEYLWPTFKALGRPNLFPQYSQACVRWPSFVLGRE